MPAVALVFQALGHGWALFIVVPAVAHVASSTDPMDKATVLSNSISEAMNCDAFAQLPGLLLLLVSAVAFGVLTVIGSRAPSIAAGGAGDSGHG